MAWEQRGNQRYYYKKQREGRRVVSEYVGTGALAEMIATLETLDRERRKAERRAWRQEQEAELSLDREIDAAGDAVRALTKAALLASGHHTHRGTWRRRRE